MTDTRIDAPFIVGIGGTLRPSSSSEMALQLALHGAEQTGARTRMFSGQELARLPMYAPDAPRVPEAEELVQALRDADGVIISSPGYHGTVSGLVKNALDFIEELREDERSYLSGRAVGCIAVAYGWQAAVGTLQTLRSVVHALRGWPTPLGAAVNSSLSRFTGDGRCDDEKAAFHLQTVGEEVTQFAAAFSGLRRPEELVGA
jgi:FMN reductase